MIKNFRTKYGVSYRNVRMLSLGSGYVSMFLAGWELSTGGEATTWLMLLILWALGSAFINILH